MKNFGHENEQRAFIKSIDEIQKGCESIVSILNKLGSGELYIGVNKTGSVLGLSCYSIELENYIYGTIHKNIEPTIYPSIYFDSNLNIVVVSFAGNRKPYSYKKDYYMRSYDENRKLDYDSIMKELSFIDSNTFFDSSKTSESFRDIDESIIKDLCARVGTKKARRASVKDTLKNLSLLTDGSINLAGRYLFSKKLPLDITINVYSDEQSKKIIKNSLVKGNIFELIEKVTKIIKEEQAKNKGSKIIVSSIIEETLLFSFLNSSFNKKEPYIIKVSPYEISFKYPGTLYSFSNFEEYFQAKNKLQNRSELISKAFSFAGKDSQSEKCLSKIEKYCKDNNVIYSGISASNNLTITYIRYNQKQKAMTLEQAILTVLTTRPTIKADLLAKKFGKTRRTIQTSIKKLKESNLITRKGSNKNGYWIVNK